LRSNKYGKDSFEVNTQQSPQPFTVETSDEVQVEELVSSGRKLKQGQLQKLTFMFKATSRKGQA